MHPRKIISACMHICVKNVFEFIVSNLNKGLYVCMYVCIYVCM